MFGEDSKDTESHGDSGAAGDGEIAALMERARAKLDTVGDEDRQELIDLIEAIRDAQAGSDAVALERGQRQLIDLLFYLEV